MAAFDVVLLFGVMLVLAMIPSSSVLLVSARAATSGFANGTAVALGIVLGDLVFVLLTIVGLTALAETMGGFFVVIKYLGGAYLIWLGIGLLRARPSTVQQDKINARSLASSFLAGLFLTLGDVKAIFFYLSLFPAFVDMAALTTLDVLLIVAVTVTAVGGVKLGYAWVASKAGRFSQGSKLQRGVQLTSGSLMVGAGTVLIAKT